MEYPVKLIYTNKGFIFPPIMGSKEVDPVTDSVQWCLDAMMDPSNSLFLFHHI